MSSFLITGLPRSRTAWLSCLFTHGRVYCHHDATGKFPEVSSLAADLMGPGFRGASDSGIIPVFDKLFELLNHPPCLFVRRNCREAAADLSECTVMPYVQCLRVCKILDKKMDECIELAGSMAMVVDFGHFDLIEVAEAYWSHLTGMPLPEDHWRRMQTMWVALIPSIMRNAALGIGGFNEASDCLRALCNERLLAH